MKKKLYIKKGFTLAEVLVSLGLLSVLAAILLPYLGSAAPSNKKLMFKKSYSSLYDVLYRVSNDPDVYPLKNYTIATGRMLRVFNYTDATGTQAGVSPVPNKFCYNVSEKLNILGPASCIAANATGTSSFTTADGIFWTIYTPISDTATTAAVAASSDITNPAIAEFPLCKTSSTCYTTRVTVDVNGSGIGPNCSSVAFTNPTTTACSSSKIEPDIYQFGVRYDGRIEVNTSDAYAISLMQNIMKVAK